MKLNNKDDAVQKITSRAKYFQDVQIWPLSDKINYTGWLNNFQDEDKKIAASILDFFVYYPEIMVDQMLGYAIGRAGEMLSKNFTLWNYDSFKHQCYYSSIPGENMNLTDSGFVFLRKMKQLGVPEDQIIGFSDLFDCLEQSRVPVPVILVDDFVGSGDQCRKAWQYRGGKHNITLAEILNTKQHKIVFAPLIINHNGYKIISTACQGLQISYSHILSDEYNLFNPQCGCWSNRESYDIGIDFITRISKKLGIPDTDGESVTDYKGYRKQGLALAFDHGTPDATLPIFYWCQDGWSPLLKKTYDR